MDPVVCADIDLVFIWPLAADSSTTSVTEDAGTWPYNAMPYPEFIGNVTATNALAQVGHAR